MKKPLAIDLFCGLGGWTQGFLAEGYDVVGFDIERHQYGPHRYPAQLVIQDVLTLHGSQFRDAAVIVASPPCQEFSRYAMPFGALWREHSRMDDDGAPAGNYQGKNTVYRGLFERCFQIATEAGVPIVIENVRAAQPHIGTAAWHYGSFYLWGNVPAIMPIGEAVKQGGDWFDNSRKFICRQSSSKSAARRKSQALIARIPFELSSHIARVFKPRT